MPLLLRMMPVSLRCRHGRCRHRPEPTTDRPGSWPRPGSSRTVSDFLNSLKFQKRPPGLSRTVQDLPGPPRTITAALRTRDGSSHGSDLGQSVAVRELGVTVALSISFRVLDEQRLSTSVFLLYFRVFFVVIVI